MLEYIVESKKGSILDRKFVQVIGQEFNISQLLLFFLSPLPGV